MDYHVATYLSWVEAIVPDFEQTHCLVGHDVEDKDVEGVVAGIHQESLQAIVMAVYPSADVVGHQESQQGWQRQ